MEAGEAAAGAQQFVETIAFGPGAWDQLPAALRETFATLSRLLQRPVAASIAAGVQPL